MEIQIIMIYKTQADFDLKFEIVYFKRKVSSSFFRDIDILD